MGYRDGMPGGLGFLAQLGPDLGMLLMAARDNPAAVAAIMNAAGVPTPDTEEFGQLFNPASDATGAFGNGDNLPAGGGIISPQLLEEATRPMVRPVQTIPIGPGSAAGGPPPATPGSLPPTPAAPPAMAMADPFGGMGFDPSAVGDSIMMPKAAGSPAQLLAAAMAPKVAQQQQWRPPQLRGLTQAQRQPPTGGIAGAQRVPDTPPKIPQLAQLLAMFLGGSRPGAKAGGGAANLGELLG